MTRFSLYFVPSALAFLLSGCDVSGSGGDSQGSSTGDDDPLTFCEYSFVVVNAGGKSIGQSCTSNAECEFGECVLPGSGGNPAGDDAVNTQFGYCSRGCDCENDTDSRLTDEEKQTLVCYNGPAGTQGKFKHILPRCSSVADCAAFDSGYTSCALPNGSGVFKTCLAL
jgi:hypothetical protein